MTDTNNTTTLEDKTELELRERLTVLEEHHNRLVDGLRYLALGMIALGVAYLVSAYAIHTLRGQLP